MNFPWNNFALTLTFVALWSSSLSEDDGLLNASSHFEEYSGDDFSGEESGSGESIFSGDEEEYSSSGDVTIRIAPTYDYTTTTAAIEDPICSNFTHGCCSESRTPAHGPKDLGCCLNTFHGCCPDFITASRESEECHCSATKDGCCSDGVTYSSNFQCGCRESSYGCCPDQYTRAQGLNYESCECHTFPYGCCSDGKTPKRGSKKDWCKKAEDNCFISEFGCCSDGKTLAKGTDLKGCDCSSSLFGCCPDGKTEAKGDGFEGCDEKPGGICYKDKDTGTCRSYNITRMWYFDMNYGGCSRFWYGGCGGNGNRFANKELCEETCVRPQGTSKCYLPPIPGPKSCTKKETFYYFDPSAQNCLAFTYNGCLGNLNRFSSFKECQDECMKAVRRSEEEDPCDQPPEPGPCRGYFQRWTYDSARGECVKFIYGGCKGNLNIYMGEKECLNSCQHKIRVLKQKRRCLRPDLIKVGTEDCNVPGSILPKWYFSKEHQKCVPFYEATDTKGSCGFLVQDERNRERIFDILEECQKSCPNVFTPIINVSSHTITVKENKEALLNVKVTSNPSSPEIIWKFNGTEVKFDSRLKLFSNGTLQIYPAKNLDSGVWTILANNGIGKGSWKDIVLSVTPSETPLKVSIKQSNKTPYQIGSTILLGCEVSGYPTPRVLWYKNNARLPLTGRVRWSESSKELIIDQARLIDNGFYTCRAWNFKEYVNSTVQIRVEKGKVKKECVDKPWLVRCDLIVKGHFCQKDKMFFQICCKSCTLAGHSMTKI